MRTLRLSLILLVAVMAPALLGAAHLDNASFETEFGPREDLNVWGEYGDSFGECYQVAVGSKDRPAKATDGKRILLINIPQNSWNGIWQQIPWEANKAYSFKGRYQIKGDLEMNTATFLKVEFYDGLDKLVGEKTGKKRTESTKGRWLRDAVRGITPEGTKSIRCVIIGGNNPDGPNVQDLIFWDEVDLIE